MGLNDVLVRIFGKLEDYNPFRNYGDYALKWAEEPTPAAPTLQEEYSIKDMPFCLSYSWEMLPDRTTREIIYLRQNGKPSSSVAECVETAWIMLEDRIPVDTDPCAVNFFKSLPPLPKHLRKVVETAEDYFVKHHAIQNMQNAIQ